VTYHASSGKIFARTIDPTLTTVGAPVLLHQSSGVGADVGRVASPEIITEGGTTYLFYEAGARLDATIAYATAATGEPPFVLDISRSVATGCASSVATLAVTVGNGTAVPVDVRITTPLGERKLTGVPAAATRTVTFTATGPNLAAGTSTVKAFARVDGVPYEQTWSLDHAARTC
jgi:hypothetical protein